MVDPIEMPRIWVCTAPATPNVQRSELPFEMICGDIAEGGGDLTVVVIEPVVVTVLFVVDSVTIGSTSCAKAEPTTLMSRISDRLFVILIGHFLRWCFCWRLLSLLSFHLNQSKLRF